MDSTAPKIAGRELFDTPDEVDRIAIDIANRIKNGKHFIAFTGAGVSTAAGIPDFRGPEGAWTLRAQGREINFKSTTTLQAIPTPTHLALVELQTRGLLKYLISQNCDGIHRRSGMLPNMISELHGNCNREYCKDCGKEFIRDFRAVSTYQKCIKDHRTGRKCTRCGGDLHDTIINFGEDLPKLAFQAAHDHAKIADLCLVLGSSLTVTPANTIPELVGQRKKATLAICNLQKTPLDDAADLRIYAKADDLMERIMNRLNIPIPAFILRRRLIIEVESQGEECHQLRVYGIDVDETPVTFLQSAKLEQSRRTARSEPFLISIRDQLDFGTQLSLELEFMGHYGEPNLVIEHEINSDADRRSRYLLEYNPKTREWRTSRECRLA